MSSIRLDNKIVWITGTTRGVGQALAISFVKRGATVVATGRRESHSDFETELKTYSKQSVFLSQDVTKPEDAEQVAAYIQKHFGRLDTLVNNAGIDPRQPVEEISQEDWSNVMETNLNGAWFTVKSALQLLKKPEFASIIQVGSIIPHANFTDLTHYMTSKMALEGMTRGLARDLGKYDIRVNCLVLGAVVVEKEKNFGTADEIVSIVNEHQCIEGRIHVEDIEPVFAFFTSTDSRAITGQSLHIDLGWTHK